MAFIEVGRENASAIELYYEDHGSGPPVVLIHGWPSSGAMWERQIPALLAAGHRVVTYDRRGFGRSSRPATGYDFDTFTADLDRLITSLDLTDMTLVGFSMGGGEVARYLGRHGTKRVSRAVFMAAITPYLGKAADNPAGVDRAVFDGIQQAIRTDRPAFLTKLFQDYYNLDQYAGNRMSDDALRLAWNVASGASPIGTVECVATWGTDFRADLKKVDVPVLVVHGDGDRIVPLPISGARMAEFVPASRLVVIPGAPHGFAWTHAEEANRELVSFLSEAAGAPRR